MPCPITAPMRSDLKEDTRQTKTKKISKNKNFTAKTEYLNLRAHSNNVKMQSDKTLTTQNNFLLTIQRMESFLIDSMLQSIRRNSKFNKHFFLTKKFQKS